jgi:hypothetical protein
MWSGGSTTWRGDPRRYSDWLRESIRHTYPQLGGVEIASVWSGTRGFTVHRMPQIGEAMPGVWLASGFAGQGLNTAAVAGSLLARAIVENDDSWRLFLPYDLVWAGGALGRAVRQGTSWWKRTRISLAARGARRRQKLARADAEADARDRARHDKLHAAESPARDPGREPTEPMQGGNSPGNSPQVPVNPAE